MEKCMELAALSGGGSVIYAVFSRFDYLLILLVGMAYFTQLFFSIDLLMAILLYMFCFLHLISLLYYFAVFMHVFLCTTVLFGFSGLLSYGEVNFSPLLQSRNGYSPLPGFRFGQVQNYRITVKC